MNLEYGVTLLVLLYALYGVIKLFNLYRKTRDLQFLTLLSVVAVVGLDAAMILFGNKGMSWFSRFHYLFALLPLLVFAVCMHLGKVRSRAVSDQVMLRNAFHPYLAESALERLAIDFEQVKLSGEKKALTILHCNIKGFRLLSEKLGPEELVHLLNMYLSELSEVGLRHQGTLDKYLGDELWAFWGAPLVVENQNLLACEAAFALTKRLKQLRGDWEKKGFPRIDIHIGLGFGKAVVGNMGSNRRFDYSIVGYPARVAKVLSRLKTYGTNILISETLKDSVKGRFVFREVDWVVMGKKRPFKVYEILDLMEEAPKYERFLEVYGSALGSYHKREWLKAKSLFEEAGRLRKSEGVCKVYLDRIKGFIHSPPSKDWDGVVRL